MLIDLFSNKYLETYTVIDKIYDKIIIKEYSNIIKLIVMMNNYYYDDKNINYVLTILKKNNLFHKYILDANFVESSTIFLYTRFFCKKPQYHGFNMNLIYNKVMHKLRCVMKRRYNKHLNRIKLELGPIIYEIKNLSSKKPIIKHAINNIKSKFTLLPPRHILPVELLGLENVLIKEKSDGIQVNTLSMFDEFNSCQIKAEYIEEHEIYLVFDIDLPNTSMKERINYLRLLHPFTKKLNNFQEINNVNDLITNIDYERNNLVTYLSQNENKIKWYPKASFCIKKMNEELLLYFNNYIEKSSDYVNTEGPIKNDGFIITKTDVEYQELKIKPKELLTIDLLFDGTKFIDQDNIVWPMIIKPENTNINKKYQKNKIYRCYPVNDKFEAREMRFDKKKPNTNKICDNVVNLIKYDWLKPCEKPSSYYYFNKNVTMNKKDIKSINSNNNFLLNIISDLELNNNLNWLDLGCGKGKYIEHIKKYNPKKYLGMDADITCLLKGYNKYNSEQSYNFYQCDLGKEWHETEYKYFTFNWQQKYDIVLCNFSIMHFNTEIFWNQLNLITKPNSIMIVNIVKPNKEFKNGNSYLKSFENTCKYYFDWVHKTEQTELLVEFNNINNWKIIKTFDNNFDDLTKCYKWYILQRI